MQEAYTFGFTIVSGSMKVVSGRASQLAFKVTGESLCSRSRGEHGEQCRDELLILASSFLCSAT